MLPADTGGANWPGGVFDPETNRLYVHSHTTAYLAGIVPADPATSDFGYVAGQARAGGARGARRGCTGCGSRCATGRCAGARRWSARGGGPPAGGQRRHLGAGPAADQAAV